MNDFPKTVPVGAPAEPPSQVDPPRDIASSMPVPQPVPLPGIVEDVQLNNIEEDRLRSMQARVGFDPYARFPEEWAERFIDLEHRYRWELAAYAIWASLPKEYRQPPTLQLLAAEVFRISPRRLRELRALHPQIEDEIVAIRKAALYDYVPDVFAALGTLAATPDFHNIPAMKLVLEIERYYVPRQEIDVGMPKWVREASQDHEAMSDDELEALAAIPDQPDLGVTGE